MFVNSDFNDLLRIFNDNRVRYLVIDVNFYQMGIPPMRVDILMGIPGGDFGKAWNNRNEVDFEGSIVHFISKQDLIDSKKASGRPQHLIDVDLLSRNAG